MNHMAEGLGSWLHRRRTPSTLSTDAAKGSFLLEREDFRVWQAEEYGGADWYCAASGACLERLLAELESSLLTEKEREALQRCYVRGESATAAAAAMGLSRSALLRLKQRALGKLRAALLPVQRYRELLAKEVSAWQASCL
ncbi:MAG: hypothetical protein LBQ33_02620 [Oscillospiraceae bacterium]|jgi:DNA-directed RNA polymerase specialized sigma24 family protein|nr:hypothetical protein [Oscillospiraceae bacterium]